MLKQQYKVKYYENYLNQTKKLIDFELSKFVSSLSHLKLHSQIKYALLSKGKRLRPLLVILSAQSVGGKAEEVMPLALAFELVHTATLVHDDIIDNDQTRRGLPALHVKWSVNDAILAGDAMIALAVNLASSYGEEILKTVSNSALELCDGEHMDISLSLGSATEEEYFLKIKEKSACLFRAAAYSGALASGGSPSEVNSLSMFGENFGIAYQLKDDLIDLKNPNSFISRDLKRGRVTLPLIHLYTTSNLKKRQQLKGHFQKALKNPEQLDSHDAERILKSLTATGSFDYIEQKIDHYLQQAIASVKPLKNTFYKEHLVQMTNWLRS
jgi:geranylgeranyl diphosphate synthase type I